MELRFKPVGNFVLIKPLAFKYTVQKQPLPKIEGKTQEELMTEETEVEYTKTKVKKSQQLGKVLSIGTLNPELTPYKEGDTIVYPVNGTLDFELVNGTKLVYAHNILGIWTS